MTGDQNMMQYSSALTANLIANEGGGTVTSFSLPCGFRFRPTDEQLVLFYLMKKISGEAKLEHSLIPEVNLYEKHPSKLTKEYKPQGDNAWYFFTKRDKRYPNGERPNRGTADGSGYWKLLDKGKGIPKSRAVGLKHTLDFIQGRNPSRKTAWKMNEYVLKAGQIKPKNGKMLDNLVLCKIYLKKSTRQNEVEDHGEDEQSSPQPAMPGSSIPSLQSMNIGTSPTSQQLSYANISYQQYVNEAPWFSAGIAPTSQQLSYANISYQQYINEAPWFSAGI